MGPANPPFQQADGVQACAAPVPPAKSGQPIAATKSAPAENPAEFAQVLSGRSGKVFKGVRRAACGAGHKLDPDEDDGTLRPEQWRITADYSQARFERAELNAVMRLRLGTILTEQQFERVAGALQIDA